MKINRVVIVSVGTILLCSAILAHVRVSNQDATGLLAVLDHFFDVALSLGLSLTLLCVGHFVCERLRVKFANVPEEIGVSLFVGTGVVGIAVLLLGLIGWLRPLPVSLFIAICIVVTRRSWSQLYRVISEVRQLRHNHEAAVCTAIYLCLIGLFALRAATPPTAADELIYHLPVPQAFVEQGRIYPVFDNSLGNLPFLVHMIYAVFIMAGSDIAARLFSLYLAVGTSLAILGFCTRYLTQRVGVLAGFAFFGAGMVVELAVTSRIDVSLAGMLFLCTYSMINYLESKNQSWLWISALLAGFSLGIKHTAVIWLALVGGMYLVQQLIISREQTLKVLRLGIGYMLLAFAVASPWYLKNYVWFGNPVYPLLTGEVAEFGPRGIRFFDENDERKLEAHFNAVRSEMPEVIEAQEEELTKAINARVPRHPLWWWEFFLKPNTYLMSEPNQYPNYLFLIIPLFVFVTKPRWVVWLLLLSLAFVFALTWTSWIARYLLPAYPPLTIVAIYTLTSVLERFVERRTAGKISLYAVAAALGVTISASAQAMINYDFLSYLTGKSSRVETITPLTYYKPIQFINNHLPADARIFIVGAQLNYGIERPYLSDESWFATKWRRLMVRNDSFEKINEDLKQQGFTHIFFSADLFKFAALMGTEGTGGMEMIAKDGNELSDEARRLGPEYQLLRNWSTFTMYKRKWLETLYSDEYGYQVFKIK